jgi:hypothetical protein
LNQTKVQGRGQVEAEKDQQFDVKCLVDDKNWTAAISCDIASTTPPAKSLDDVSHSENLQLPYRKRFKATTNMTGASITCIADFQISEKRLVHVMQCPIKCDQTYVNITMADRYRWTSPTLVVSRW